MVQPFALEFRRKQTPCGWPECKHTPGQPTSHGDSHMGAPDSRRRLFNLLQGSRVSLDMVRALGAGIQKVSERLGQRPLPIARQMAQFMTEPTFIPVSGYLAPAFADHPRGRLPVPGIPRPLVGSGVFLPGRRGPTRVIQVSVRSQRGILARHRTCR